eukprot:NODE_11_length_54881_cov_1.430718.p44 type:complete len:106 gc:universal NODE_11_length_54881_cov_1.430718:39492-39809(+)
MIAKLNSSSNIIKIAIRCLFEFIVSQCLQIIYIILIRFQDSTANECTWKLSLGLYVEILQPMINVQDFYLSSNYLGRRNTFVFSPPIHRLFGDFTLNKFTEFYCS